MLPCIFTRPMFGALLLASLVICHPSLSHQTPPHDNGGASPLCLHATVQSSMTGPHSLSLVATFVNEGNTTLTVMTDPDGPLHILPTHKFNFFKQHHRVQRSQQNISTSVVPAVNVVRVKYDGNVTAALSDPGRHVVLHAGKNTTIIHDLSGIYAFKESGLYTLKLATGAKYLRVADKNKRSTKYVPIRAHNNPEASWATTVYVGDSVVRSSLQYMDNKATSQNVRVNESDSKYLYKRYSSRNCNQQQQAAIVNAIRSAQWYIGESNKFLDQQRSAHGRRFKSWFGNPDGASMSGVRKRFKLLNGQPARFQYDCSCQHPGIHAFVYPSRFGVVYLCPSYWRAPVTGVDSKAGTLVHEATHFPQLGKTQDYVVGPQQAFALAKQYPKYAVMNADNYEYFSEYFKMR